MILQVSATSVPTFVISPHSEIFFDLATGLYMPAAPLCVIMLTASRVHTLSFLSSYFETDVLRVKVGTWNGFENWARMAWHAAAKPWQGEDQSCKTSDRHSAPWRDQKSNWHFLVSSKASDILWPCIQHMDTVQTVNKTADLRQFMYRKGKYKGKGSLI